jgi:hypothetical protein
LTLRVCDTLVFGKCGGMAARLERRPSASAVIE